MSIVVYTKPACVQCDSTIRALDAAGIVYTTVDLTTDHDARDYPAVGERLPQGAVRERGDPRPAGRPLDLELDLGTARKEERHSAGGRRGVRVDQGGGPACARQFDRELDRDRGTARRALRAVEATDGPLLLTAPGLLARLDPRGGTLADAGTALRYKGISTGVVLAADPTTPGTLHAVALHSEVLRHRELPLLGTLALSAGPQDLSWSLPEEWETMTA